MSPSAPTYTYIFVHVQHICANAHTCLLTHTNAHIHIPTYAGGERQRVQRASARSYLVTLTIHCIYIEYTLSPRDSRSLLGLQIFIGSESFSILTCARHILFSSHGAGGGHDQERDRPTHTPPWGRKRGSSVKQGQADRGGGGPGAPSQCISCMRLVQVRC